MRGPPCLAVRLGAALAVASFGAADLAWAGPKPYEESGAKATAPQGPRDQDRLKRYDRGEEQPPIEWHFPWELLGLGVAAFAGAAPFAWIAYAQLKQELQKTKAAHGRRGS